MNNEFKSDLGKNITYDSTYNPNRLFPVPRDLKRKEIGIHDHNLPFYGVDCWNHYEVSWLNENGKPIVALAEIIYDCTTPNIVESKSLKLYFNSLNQTKLKNTQTFIEIVEKDLSDCVGGEVNVNVVHLLDAKHINYFTHFKGICLDSIDTDCSIYTVDNSYLTTRDQLVEETLYSDLLKSNCLVTNQPDWGSVQISYRGNQINHEGLLKYIVSFRLHNEFHEQCIERIYVDIMQRCKPEKLTVHGRYTRRGGIDINPFRSSEKSATLGNDFRLIRQ